MTAASSSWSCSSQGRVCRDEIERNEETEDTASSVGAKTVTSVDDAKSREELLSTLMKKENAAEEKSVVLSISVTFLFLLELLVAIGIARPMEEHKACFKVSVQKVVDDLKELKEKTAKFELKELKKKTAIWKTKEDGKHVPAAEDASSNK